MSWFKDYVYIPLGGSRRGKLRKNINILIVYVLSGLWHGASWNYVCWGFAFGVLLLFYNAIGANKKYPINTITGSRYHPGVKEFFEMLLTFIVFVIVTVFIRSDSLPQACSFIYGIFTHVPSLSDVLGTIGKGDLLMCAALIYFEYLQRDKEHALQIDGIRLFRYAPVRYLLYLTLLTIMFIYSGQVQTFIYFQF